MHRVKTESMLEAAVIYGYWPAQSEGQQIIIWDPADPEREIGRFNFPRQQRGRHLCLADYVRPTSSGEMDVVAFHIVTMGNRISVAANELFAANDLPRLHGTAWFVGAVDGSSRRVLARSHPVRVGD